MVTLDPSAKAIFDPLTIGKVFC